MPIPARRFLLALSTCSLLIGGMLTAASASAKHRYGTSSEPTSGVEGEAAPQAPGTPPEQGGTGKSGSTGESGSPTEGLTPPPTQGGPPKRRANAHRAAGCDLTLEASSDLVTAGETVTLQGKFSCPEGTAAAGETVTISQRHRGGGGPSSSELATVTVGEDGSYQLTTGALTRKSTFVAHAALVRRGARTVVRVAPLITLAGPAADGARLASRADRRGAGGGARNRFTFTGTVDPAAAGTQVALQREYAASGDGWRTIAFGRVDEEGHYSIAHGFRSAGIVSVRVISHPKDEVASASEPLTYVIVQAQNPQLTIESSADPIVSGESTTITGVAAGASNQSVTLLARVQGHEPEVVAKATTDGGGAYSFTVSPTQNTYYRVLSGSAASTQLFEGVKYTLTTSPPPSTVETGTTVTFSGTLLPAPAGQVVLLQRRNPSGIGFHTVSSGTLDGSHSYSIPFVFGGVGSSTMRIKAPGGWETLGATSEPFTIAVTPAAGS